MQWIVEPGELGQPAAQSDPSCVLVSPYPGQPAKVIATAWGSQLRVNSTADPRLREFVLRYHAGGQGGEQGAACAAVNPEQAQQLFAQGPPAGQPGPPVPADQPTRAAGG